jgi:hypothetical protein
MTYLESTATVSPCGLYRYDLRRVWDAARPPCLFVMLNPSTADGSQDDPTIRRCVGFAKAWEMGGVVVVNLFALRATDPGRLQFASRRGVDALGRANYVRTLFSQHAWNLPLHHLGLTKDGHPRHPLYVKGSTLPAPWEFA